MVPLTKEVGLSNGRKEGSSYTVRKAPRSSITCCCLSVLTTYTQQN